MELRESWHSQHFHNDKITLAAAAAAAAGTTASVCRRTGYSFYYVVQLVSDVMWPTEGVVYNGTGKFGCGD
jgi:hypothetical protein